MSADASQVRELNRRVVTQSPLTIETPLNEETPPRLTFFYYTG